MKAPRVEHVLEVERYARSRAHVEHVSETFVSRAPAMRDRADVGERAHDSLCVQKAHSQKRIVARRAHRYRDGFTIDTDLERLFDRDGVVGGAGARATQTLDA